MYNRIIFILAGKGSRMHGRYLTYKYKKYRYVANLIIHSLEMFEDGRMDACHGILPRIDSLQTRGQS
jgi:hypothetical protein